MLDWLNLDPVAFNIPIGDGFPIYWYAIFVTWGIAIGAIWAAREIEKRGQSSDELFNGLLLVVFAGYFFARITYVLLDMANGNGARYNSIIDVVNLRAGGANIMGGFVGAALLGWLFIRIRKLDTWHYADVAGPALLIAQAIGRWGNFVNQELYGPPTNLPWGITIDSQYRLPQYSIVNFPLDTRFHPTFLYESLWLLIGFVALVVLNARFRDTWRSGTLFGLFLLWWGGGRFIIEFFRPDQATIGDSWFTYSMLISLLLAVVGLLIVLYKGRRLPANLQERFEARGKQANPKRRVAKPKLQRTE